MILKNKTEKNKKLPQASNILIFFPPYTKADIEIPKLNLKKKTSDTSFYPYLTHFKNGKTSPYS